jgi:hypothetical protein
MKGSAATELPRYLTIQNVKTLSSEEQATLFATLKTRFEKK